VQPDFSGLVLGGKYRLVAPLGTGGMGHVWQAEHVQLGRAFAVKLLRAELVSDPAALARFQQEAQAAARIGSRHIVEVFDVGRTPGGAPYLVMELLRGRPLSAELAARGPLPVARALDVADQLLDGLTAAHAAGIVHRDLKPDNVFLLDGPGGRDWVKIVDFGVAKAKDDPKVQQLTRTGMLLGTPSYMSPEQVLGRRDVDRRADLWAVGVILYECLTGRVPFEASDVAGTLTAILQRSPVSLEARRPEVGPRLGAVVLRALAKDPAERFGDAAEFRAALAGAAPAGAGAGRAGPVVVGAEGAASSRSGSTVGPQAVAAPTFPPGGPRVWPWLLAGLLVVGAGGVAIGFVAMRAGGGSGGSAGVVGGTATEGGPVSEVGGAPVEVGPAFADGGAPVGPGQVFASGKAPEEPSRDDPRERWLRIQTESGCWFSRELRRRNQPPTNAEVWDRLREACVREGLEEQACFAEVMRFLGDAEAKAERERRVMQCLSQAEEAVDGGAGEAR